jgi:predicted HNH restriction endonuclease
VGKIYRLSEIPSSAEYITGLVAIQLRMSELQLRLIQEQYHAPRRTVTATQLAELAGVESGRGTVNLMYGRLGRLFCEVTGFEPSKREIGTHRWWSVWSKGYEERNPYRFFWEMHPEVAEALERLGWVVPNVTEASSTKILYEEIFSDLMYDRDDRSPPDNRRRAQFKIGWKNATSQRIPYTDTTLKAVLTWNNLGYRFGEKLKYESEIEINTVYDFLAQRYSIKGTELSSKNAARIFPDEVNAEEVFCEGAVRQVLVNTYERDPKARQKCIAHYGLSCSVCDFNFGRVFGQLGEGFIHVHHLHEISKIAEEYEVDPVKDLRPVCPNCHAMIHRRSPPFSIEEIRSLLNSVRENSAF